jgi:predicted metalloendopeptidase
MTDAQLGEALGQPYVAETFGAEGKQRMLNMVDALETALAADIQDLPWMTPDTKKQAQFKLKAITNKIGCPDKWRKYSTFSPELLADAALQLVIPGEQVQQSLGEGVRRSHDFSWARHANDIVLSAINLRRKKTTGSQNS